MPIREGVFYHEYIRTEEFFYDELSEREAERIVLDAMAALMVNDGYQYLEPLARPVVPRTRDSFVPAVSLTVEERLNAAYVSTVRFFKLQDLYGKDNIWEGPELSDIPVFAGLSVSEQRGFWVKHPQTLQEQQEDPRLSLSV